MIHKTDDGTFVASSKSSWIPGCFDSERAARYAFRFTIFQLQKLQNEKNKTSGVITFKDLQDLKQNQNNMSKKKTRHSAKDGKFVSKEFAEANPDEVVEVTNHDHKEGWINASKRLPEHLETVWISNGKGWTSLGCRVETNEGWNWALSVGIIYEEKGKIIAECEDEDLDVVWWHPVPDAPAVVSEYLTEK